MVKEEEEKKKKWIVENNERQPQRLEAQGPKAKGGSIRGSPVTQSRVVSHWTTFRHIPASGGSPKSILPSLLPSIHKHTKSQG
jgi:hypothetical protein